MKKILCIGPGYSLKKASELYSKGCYAGHLLYGVNHITDQLDIILEPQTEEPGRIKAEFLHVRNYFKIRPDVIYITFSNYGILLLLLRKIHIVQAPVVALFHEYQENLLFSHGIIDKVKKYVMNWLRRVELSAADYPIFISKYGFEHAHSTRKRYVPLMPELIDEIKQARRDEDYSYIISVGKTKRNYQPLFRAAEHHHDLNLKIITNQIDGAPDLENIHIIDRLVPYNEVLNYYRDALAICVPSDETGGGIYGLSSLLDALSVHKPIITSKTIGLEIDVDKLQIGRTYQCGSSKSFYEAYQYVREHHLEMENNIEKLTRTFNARAFGNKISEILMKAAYDKE